MGFYGTLNEMQARNFAIKVTKLRKTGAPYVSIYNVDENCYNKLNILKFDSPDEKWFDFVCENRQGKYIGEKYDCVYGPVANDDVYTTFVAYNNGILTKEQALDGLKVKKLYNQLLFANEKSLNALQFQKAYEVK